MGVIWSPFFCLPLQKWFVDALSCDKKYGEAMITRCIGTNLGQPNTMVHSKMSENEVNTTLFDFFVCWRRETMQSLTYGDSTHKIYDMFKRSLLCELYDSSKLLI
jgi:hypothetical protein